MAWNERCSGNKIQKNKLRDQYIRIIINQCKCHMTNTRITDAEVLERRYPVLLRQFEIRKGSGGDGAFKGGDGITREFEFLAPLNVSILSERRVFAPFGLCGG